MAVYASLVEAALCSVHHQILPCWEICVHVNELTGKYKNCKRVSWGNSWCSDIQISYFR
jgi:hypothetical protein